MKMILGILSSNRDDEMKMELWYNKQRLCHHKARKQQMNKLMSAHKELAVAHTNYIRSLRSVGCSLFHFASNGDALLCRNNSSGLEKMMTKVHKCFFTAADSGKDLPIFVEWPQRSSLWLTKKNLTPNRLHHSTTTVEKMYDLEKKLYQQLKSVKLNNNINIAAAEEIEKDIEATSLEIKKLSDRDMYDDVVKLVRGLMCMWTTMYECHHEQVQILLNYIPSCTGGQTTKIHDQQYVKFEREIKQELTRQLERDIKQWMNCFCSFMACQRVYTASLNGWIRLINYSSSNCTINKKNKIYSLCKDWSRAFEHISDKAATEGIKHLLTTVRDIKVHEQKVHRHDMRCASMWKKLEKERHELMCMECKFKQLEQHHPSNSTSSSSSDIEEKRAKVAELMAKAEDEQRKSINLTRTTHSNLVELGLPHTIQALLQFAIESKDAFHSIYNRAQSLEGNNTS